MKNRIIKLSIFLLITMALFTGCKIQSVEEYNKDELFELEEDIEIVKVDGNKDENKEKNQGEIKEVDVNKENDKVVDNKEKDKVEKDKVLDKTNKSENKSNSKSDANDKNVINQNNEDKDKNKLETKPQTNNKTKVESKPTETQKPVPAPKPTETTKPTPTPKPKPAEKPKPAPAPTPAPTKKYVTIEIRVDTILKNYDKLDSKLQSTKFVPSNGTILQKSEFELNDGETAFDILVRATRQNRIHMSYQGGSSVYIKGINNIYEFSCGELSGWMYKVNGSYPNYSVSAYELKDGDSISFNYTCNLGRDLGQNGINQ